jgi:hypothetical protein
MMANFLSMFLCAGIGEASMKNIKNKVSPTDSKAIAQPTTMRVVARRLLQDGASTAAMRQATAANAKVPIASAAVAISCASVINSHRFASSSSSNFKSQSNFTSSSSTFFLATATAAASASALAFYLSSSESNQLHADAQVSSSAATLSNAEPSIVDPDTKVELPTTLDLTYPDKAGAVNTQHKFFYVGSGVRQVGILQCCFFLDMWYREGLENTFLL